MLGGFIAAVLLASFIFIAVVTFSKLINLIEERLKKGAGEITTGRAETVLIDELNKAIVNAQKFSLDELNDIKKVKDKITPDTIFIADINNEQVDNLSLINTNRLDDEVNALYDNNNGLLRVAVS